MSGHRGPPQQDPRGTEGVQPRTPEGVQQREFLHHISISPSSLVSPQQQLIGEGLQPDTPTPIRNLPLETDEGVQNQVTLPEDVPMANQGWNLQTNQAASEWDGPDNVTTNASSAQDWTTAEYTNPHYQVEPVQSHVTANAFGSQDQSQSHLTSESMVLDRPHIGHVTQFSGSTPQPTPSTPQNTVPPEERIVRVPYEAGQHLLRRTARGESPTDYVSTGSSTPVSKCSKLSPDDPMNIESHGYQSSESPHLVTPQPNTPSSTSSTTVTIAVSFAQMAKGKGKAMQAETTGSQSSTPILHRTWCNLKEFEDTRIPPVTDAKFSAWFNMQDTYEDQAAIYRFAGLSPNIFGLSYRPSQKWTEFYCRSAEQMKTLLSQEWTIGQTKVKLLTPRKLVGSRIFLKFVNVTPCHSEEEIRESIAKFMSGYGTPGRIEPHYILDPTGELPDVRLCTRRWDAELFIPERTRLIMDSVPLILDTETVVYWKGQRAVCQICKITGHWAKDCNSVLRAQAQAEKMKLIPPAPFTNPAITQSDPQPTPVQTPAATEATSSKSTNQKQTPPTGTPKQTPPQTTTPKDAPQKSAPQKETPAKPAARVVKESEIIQQSREANMATGNAPVAETIIIRNEDDGWTKAKTRSQKRKEAAVTRKKSKDKAASDSESAAEGSRKNPRLPPTAIQTSNRPRTVGNQLQYYLYMMERGQILSSELQMYINKAEPTSFITTTKPAIKQKDYESFSNWVQKRRRANKDDMQDVARWKVSMPDHMNPK